MKNVTFRGKTMTAKNSARNSAISLKTSAKYDSPSKRYID